MLTVLLQGSQILLSMFEVWLCYQLLYEMIIEKKSLTSKDKIVIRCNILVLSLFLAFNRNIVFFSYIMFIIEVFFTVICVKFITGKNILLISGIILSYYSLISLIYFFLLFMSTIFINEMFLYDYYGVSSFQSPIYFVSCTIVLGFLQLLKSKAGILREYISDYKNLILGLGIFLAFVLRRYQIIRIEMMSSKLQNQTLKSGLSLLLFIVISCIFVSLMFKSLILQKENHFLAKRDELLSKNYQGMMQSIEKNSRMIHDIKHHLVVLNEYGREGELEKIRSYLQNISGHFSKTNGITWTGNKVLDFLLNEKKEEAEKKGIVFEIHASALLKQPLSDSDICVLFGNLLDNAIEACEKIQEGTRWIEVKLEKRQQLFLIEISNSMYRVPLIENGRFITRKPDKEFHGYGLRSVKHIVYKYEGAFSYHIKEDMFTVNLSFFENEK